MHLGSLQVGNVFRYELGTAVKVREGGQCDALPCLNYALVNLKRLVYPLAKIESYAFSPKISDQPLEPIRAIPWGTVIRLPHAEVYLLVTSGIATTGIIVCKLGKDIHLDADLDVRDLGYSGEHIGIPKLDEPIALD